MDFRLGFGTAHDSANSGGIENINSINAFATCTPPGDGFCDPNPSLSGFFLGVGGDVMLWKHLGLGAQADFMPARSNYGPLLYRQAFYDINAVYVPISSKRFDVHLEGGIGGAHTGFGINESGCVGVAVCSSTIEPVGSSNHFDVHVGVGISVYLTEHIFIRPQFDFHYAPGLTNQFNSNAVPAGMVWVGYNIGER